jgi:hypothetical protein
MKTLLEPVWSYLRELTRAIVRGWPRFWFTPADCTTVALIRICVGLVVFYTHLATITDFVDFVGPEAWVDQQAIAEIRNPDTWKTNAGFLSAEEAERMARFERATQSFWFYVENPTAIWIVHGLFMLSTLCMTLGLFSRTTSVIVWAGHLSFIHRARALWYGMDTMLAFLLLYLMFAPTGRTLSLDRWLAQRRRIKRARDAGARFMPEPEPPQPSVAANLVIRLIQIHLCICYLCSGLAKLQGNMWWSGTAIYYTLMISDFAPFDMIWMPRHLPVWMLHFITCAGVAYTLFYEIGFTFLVWHRMWRPIMLFLGMVMHIGITLTMGLGSFQVTMMVALIAFVKPESARWFVDVLLRRPQTQPNKVEMPEPAESPRRDRSRVRSA